MEEEIFERIEGDESPRTITPYVMMEHVYNPYDQFDIITHLAFHRDPVYIVLYDAPMELMLAALQDISRELHACIQDQPHTFFAFHCHEGTNPIVTLSFSYLYLLSGTCYELVVYTVHDHRIGSFVRLFMEERKRRVLPSK